MLGIRAAGRLLPPAAARAAGRGGTHAGAAVRRLRVLTPPGWICLGGASEAPSTQACEPPRRDPAASLRSRGGGGALRKLWHQRPLSTGGRGGEAEGDADEEGDSGGCRHPHFEARRVILEAAKTLQALAGRVGSSFDRAVALIESVPPGGRVVLTGVGKSGHVARKVAASMSSTGTCAFFIHATEALHGDLGSVRAGDVCIAISYSGETQETLAAMRGFQKLSGGCIAITSNPRSSLGRECDVCLELGSITELDHNRLAPTASTAAAMALGDALTVVISKRRGFTRGDFDLFHPGGQLGLQNKMALRAERELEEQLLATGDKMAEEKL